MTKTKFNLLTLLHTNDFHNHFTEEQSSNLGAQKRSLGESVILLDAGDAVASGNITFRPGGEPILDRMNEAGYDAMTVGNREFHFSRLGFHSKVSRATFPILCANVRPSKHYDHTESVGTVGDRDADRDTESVNLERFHSSGSILPVRSHTLLVREEYKVLIVGLTVPMITERMASRRISSYIFDDPVKTAAKILPGLLSRYSPDIVIALTHIGIKRDRELAEAIPAIDLIIGGHTHVILDSGEKVGDTMIVQAGSFGRLVGKVEIRGKKTDGAQLEMSASVCKL